MHLVYTCSRQCVTFCILEVVTYFSPYCCTFLPLFFWFVSLRLIIALFELINPEIRLVSTGCVRRVLRGLQCTSGYNLDTYVCSLLVFICNFFTHMFCVYVIFFSPSCHLFSHKIFYISVFQGGSQLLCACIACCLCCCTISWRVCLMCCEINAVCIVMLLFIVE